MEQKTPEIGPKGPKPYNGGPIGISGPPGAGKSTIGRKVAKELGIPFYDLDNLISEKAGLENTKKVIEKHGRPYFKEVQHSCLKELFQKGKGRYVLAFGGGIHRPEYSSDLTEKNRVLLRKHLFNICLMPSRKLDKIVSILWPRQEDYKRDTGVKSSKQLRSYLEESISQYITEADRVIYTHHAPIEKVISAVVEVLKQ